MGSIFDFWGKTKQEGEAWVWHPLVYHCLDVSACADAILMREPDATRKRMAAILGLEWDEARAWLLLVVACHDLGKACPGFQAKWPNLLGLTGLSLPRSPTTEINHAFVSQVALDEILRDKGWPAELAELVADAVGCHHGSRASPRALEKLEFDERAIGREDWAQAREGLVGALSTVFQPRRGLGLLSVIPVP